MMRARELGGMARQDSTHSSTSPTPTSSAVRVQPVGKLRDASGLAPHRMIGQPMLTPPSSSRWETLGQSFPGSGPHGAAHHCRRRRRLVGWPAAQKTRSLATLSVCSQRALPSRPQAAQVALPARTAVRCASSRDARGTCACVSCATARLCE